MDKVTFGAMIGLLSITALTALAGDRLVTEDEFINVLGGESPVVRTRSIGTRDIVVKPKEVTIAINFKFDSTELADQRSHLQLAEAGKALSSDELSRITVEIAGHTDSTGSDDYNRALSQRRAEKIKNDLMTFYGIVPHRLIARGYGEDYPVASNDIEAGRAKNRRVVIKRLE